MTCTSLGPPSNCRALRGGRGSTVAGFNKGIALYPHSRLRRDSGWAASPHAPGGRGQLLAGGQSGWGTVSTPKVECVVTGVWVCITNPGNQQFQTHPNGDPSSTQAELGASRSVSVYLGAPIW
jgi:hypothetical protein